MYKNTEETLALILYTFFEQRTNKTFSDQDILRFYVRYLTFDEKRNVEAYFKDLLSDEIISDFLKENPLYEIGNNFLQYLANIGFDYLQSTDLFTFIDTFGELTSTWQSVLLLICLGAIANRLHSNNSTYLSNLSELNVFCFSWIAREACVILVSKYFPPYWEIIKKQYKNYLTFIGPELHQYDEYLINKYSTWLGEGEPTVRMFAPDIITEFWPKYLGSIVAKILTSEYNVINKEKVEESLQTYWAG